MNRISASKFPSLVLLLVMLLNPVIGTAGSLFLQNFGLEKNIQEAQSLNISADMSESCHDHASTNSTLLDENSNQKLSECCEDACMCGQTGCHSPAATIGITSSSIHTHSISFYSYAVNYLSPTLSSQTPPPII